MRRLFLVACALMIASAWTPASRADDPPKSEGKARVFEMRTYTAHDGRAEAMHKRFRDHTCRLFKSHGMELVGFWVPEGDKSKLVYILAFPSREAAKTSWKAFLDDAEWKKVYAESHKDGPIVMKIDSVFMESTDYSPIR